MPTSNGGETWGCCGVQVMSMIPGFSNAMAGQGADEHTNDRIKQFMCMMDSMTNEELDSTNPKIFEAGQHPFLPVAAGFSLLTQNVAVVATCHLPETRQRLRMCSTLAYPLLSASYELSNSCHCL